jgi:tetratricopeptide (TPR) repeat protein
MLNAAQFYTATNESQKALGYLEQAEKTFAAINTDSALARLYQAYSFYYQRQNDLPRAEEYLVKVIKLHRQLPDQYAMQLASNYQSLAGLRRQQNKLEEFEADLKTGLAYALRTQKPEERFVISTVISSLLDYYHEKNELDKAQTLLVDTIPELGEHTDALNQFVASYLHQELGWLHGNKAEIASAMEQFNQALQLTNASEESSSDEYSDPFAKVNIYLAMAAVQYRNGNLTVSESHMKEAEQLVTANHYQSLADYIQNYLPVLPEAVTNEMEIDTGRENKRWKLIDEAYKKLSSEANKPNP